MQYLNQYYKSSPLLTSLFTLMAAVFLPIVVHLAPSVQGTPIGAILLPMFYVPLIALVLFGKTPALAAAALSPAINFLISGNEQWSLMLLLTIELIVFTLSLAYLKNKLGNGWSVLPSILMAKVIGAAGLVWLDFLPLTPAGYFFQSLTNGLPGIIILLILGFAVPGIREESDKNQL